VNDEIVARLQRKASTGNLRVGLPNDYAVAFFQKALVQFSKQHPDVSISIHCDTSELLMTMFENDELDIVVAMFEGTPPPGLIYTWAERPIWAASGRHEITRSHRRPPGGMPLPRAHDPQSGPDRQAVADHLQQPRHQWSAAGRAVWFRGDGTDAADSHAWHAHSHGE